jgi:hypothetical protein
LKAPFVQKQGDPLARGEFSFAVLRGDPRRASAQERLLALAFQLL